MEIDKIYNCDCVDGMQQLDAESIDLVVTSPPYDKLRNYNGIWKSWNHTKFMSVANELFRITKDGGVVVWNVNDQTEKGSKTGTSFRQALFFMEIGFNLNDVMIWQKTNPLPQVRQQRYNACYEFMFVFSKGKPKTFNPIMRKTKYGGQEYHSTAKNIGGENGRRNLDTIINNESVDYNIWQIAVAQIKQDILLFSQYRYQSDIYVLGLTRMILFLTHLLVLVRLLSLLSRKSDTILEWNSIKSITILHVSE